MDSSWKKMFVGEKMPDKNDPQYKERYEREVKAGRKFADVTGISKMAGFLQLYGQTHKKAFLAITFGFILTLFFFNTVRLISVFSRIGTGTPPSVVERIDSALVKSHRINH